MSSFEQDIISIMSRNTLHHSGLLYVIINKNGGEEILRKRTELMFITASHLFRSSREQVQLPHEGLSIKMTEKRFCGKDKELLFTASHSFRSSPGGSLTASLRFPLPRVASMCFRSWAPCIIVYSKMKKM